MRTLAPDILFSACVPFALDPLRKRFPNIEWGDYNDASRAQSIARCDAWLGLGGSPFQSAQSRWFVDHLIQDAALCRTNGKPMFYLGIGAQTEAEATSAETRNLCAQAAQVWTRDAFSADRLSGALPAGTPIRAAADTAHILFQDTPPPSAKPGRLTLVPNFDFAEWRGQDAMLRAIENLHVSERTWLAQESRELPGAERALFGTLPAKARSDWSLTTPDIPGAPLDRVLESWPSGEWLVTARYHAAIAGTWAGSKTLVIATNEKLRSAARELKLPMVSPNASNAEVADALIHSTASEKPAVLAETAYKACREFVTSVSSFASA